MWVPRWDGGEGRRESFECQARVQGEGWILSPGKVLPLPSSHCNLSSQITRRLKSTSFKSGLGLEHGLLTPSPELTLHPASSLSWPPFQAVVFAQNPSPGQRAEKYLLMSPPTLPPGGPKGYLTEKFSYITLS